MAASSVMVVATSTTLLFTLATNTFLANPSLIDFINFHGGSTYWGTVCLLHPENEY